MRNIVCSQWFLCYTTVHNCLFTVVPTLDVTISHVGGPFIAGQSYNLTCTVTLENAAGTPTVGWLNPNNNPLHSSSDITVGDTVAVNCSTYTTTLQFTTLRTSHGGQYSCQATLGAVNNTIITNVTVQSKSVLSFHVVMFGISFCFHTLHAILYSSFSKCDHYN